MGKERIYCYNVRTEADYDGTDYYCGICGNAGFPRVLHYYPQNISKRKQKNGCADMRVADGGTGGADVLPAGHCAAKPVKGKEDFYSPRLPAGFLRLKSRRFLLINITKKDYIKYNPFCQVFFKKTIRARRSQANG